MLDVELPEISAHALRARRWIAFGSDKPDLRIPLELVSVDDLMQQVEFKVFAGPADDPSRRVAALTSAGRSHHQS